MSDRWLLVLTLALALILPVSALSRRKLNFRKGLGLVIVWIAIFIVAAWAFKAVAAPPLPRSI